MRKLNIPKPAKPQTEVYTAAHATNQLHSALPSPLSSFYFLLMSGSITGLAYFIGDKWNGNGALWSVIAIATMTVIGLILMAFKSRKAKKAAQEQGAGFDAALRTASSGWDDSVSSPNQIAKLSELRDTFLGGIKTFQDYGKDLYSMPWYVIVGEPGSGKSEAIRRSELRFPEMLQNKLQGTGGTYSMHWWFTNQAIVLDTAGAMLMQPESAARFEEFLKLLRTYRAACPINGMILTIPADKLLSDPPHVAEDKARTIASQLAMIQKALDIRFPIYLMVSKSDRLPGFREFFDAEGQSKFERQMMGWANPAPLGSPFSSETIFTAIDSISRRLQGRCLSLLENPVPIKSGGRRADEVDLVYTFPSSLRNLAPRLKLYLDVLFQTGTWAQKPPFFRGLFFTTALREGAELDADLAQSLGLRLDQLPPDGIVARDKSVFLRDFFLEKIFPEKGLVTRLFDVGAHLRKRLTTFYTATAAILILALGFAWLVKNRIEEQLSEEQAMWASANATWQNGTFLRFIGRSASWSDQVPDRPSWYLVGSTQAAASPGKTRPPLEELEKIHARVSAKIFLSWVFYPIPEWRDFLARRKWACLTLHEGSIMKPVLDAARERLLWDVAPGNTTTAETQKRLAAAYQRLVELESWLDSSAQKTPNQQDWQHWFQDLLRYITDPSPPGGFPPAAVAAAQEQPDAHRIDSMARDLAARTHEIYGTQVSLASRQWMRDADNQAESALKPGADFIFGKTRAEAASNDATRQEDAERIQAALKYINDAEQNLLAMVDNKPQGPRDAVHSEGLVPLNRALEAYRRAADDIRSKSNQSQLSMDLVSNTAKAILEVSDSMNDVPDGLEYAAALARKTQAAPGGPASAGPPDAEGAWMSAHKRYVAYMEAFTQMRSQNIGISMGRLVGSLSQKLQEVTEHIKTATPPAPPPATDKAPGTADEPQDRVITYLQKFRGTPLISEVFRSYEQELRTQLAQLLRFPLVKHRESYPDDFAFQTACGQLVKIEKDIESLSQFSSPIYQCAERVPVDELFKKLEIVSTIKTALTNDNLAIEVDAITPANKSTKQTETTDAALTPPQPAADGLSAASPRTSVMEDILQGWTNITVMISGSRKVDGPPNGDSTRIKYGNGFHQVSIILTFTQPPPNPPKSYPYNSPAGPWPLLREAANRGVNRFQIGGSGKVFVLQSNPSLPFSMWPDHKDFMPR